MIFQQRLSEVSKLHGMTEEEMKLSNERYKLTVLIKELDKKLGKEKRKLTSNKIKESDKDTINGEIKNIEDQIKYHIFAFNKITDKLYGRGD